jgi:hypothetical protein
MNDFGLEPIHQAAERPESFETGLSRRQCVNGNTQGANGSHVNVVLAVVPDGHRRLEPITVHCLQKVV